MLRRNSRIRIPLAVLAAGVVVGALPALGDAFSADVQPLLINYCYDCHGDGSDKGNVAFDELKGPPAGAAHRDLWIMVLKNLRAQVMPPAGKDRPAPDEQAKIESWIKREVFKIDPNDIDPGRVTLRRLNRIEYQNTIRDLMGIEFRAYEEFPPDDTGYGFDNIGDVLTVSPLLLEKYMDAAETIVGRAVPAVTHVVAKQQASGEEFKSADGKLDAGRISFYQPAEVAHAFTTKQAGDFTLQINAEVDGAFNFDPGRMNLTIRLGDDVLVTEEHKWQDGKKVKYDFNRHLDPGEHVVSFKIEPLVPEDQKKTSVDFRLRNVVLQGPTAKVLWVHPENYERFFTKDEPPADKLERSHYAGEVLRQFAERAFRRPVDDTTIAKLTAIAESEYSQPGKTFEYGVGRAMVAVLASPRFLFRTEGIDPADPKGQHPLIDEYSLASRLSYFLWSTMPDEELFDLAAKHQLREHLHEQVKRMLADKRSSQFVKNFVGQWLEARDVDGISINERSVLARDAGTDRDQEARRARFGELRKIQPDKLTPEQKKEMDEILAAFRRRRGPRVELDGELRRAMRRESEMVFDYIMREDRSVLEFLESDYTFLNEKLAKLYDIPDVKGDEMRKVMLPPGSPRGGVLSQGTVLVVTSNPTRTSPVKRGVFLLNEILGTPAPPPPANIPALEAAEQEFKDHQPTLRETLELHRSKPLCKSCHDRMDPLGLALENFNALGMWRESERKQPITPAGELITGEKFSNVQELKHILATDRRMDFYRCLTEKLLTYALGRGLEYYDTQTVDDIVARLQNNDGHFSAVLMGVIDSPPFQKRRRDKNLTSTQKPDESQRLAQSTDRP